MTSENNAGDLPVPGRRVLARRALGHHSVCPGRFGDRLHSLYVCEPSEAEGRHVRKLDTPDGLGNVLQGGRAGVAVATGIRRSADADGVEHH
jgi:hypothetical protein